MKVLVLRLYNSTPEYDLMKDVHVKNDDSIFLTFNPNLEKEWNYHSDKRLLEIKGEESINPGTRIKTLKALEICLELFDFDFLVRSNMSTVIDINLLKQKLQYMKTTNVYGGHVWNLIWEDIPSGITQDVLSKHRNTQFISGTSIILSRDNCKFIVDNQHTLNVNVVDDVAIGIIMKQKQLPNLFLNFENGPMTDKNIVFFRFCNKNDRMNDSKRMEIQYSLFKD